MSKRVHSHTGSSPWNCGRLLENDLGNRNPQHRHAHTVLWKRQSESWDIYTHSVLGFGPRRIVPVMGSNLHIFVFVVFQIRCHKYWPEDNKPMTVFSDILISKVSEEAFPDWTIRTLKVEKVQTNPFAYINSQSHYTSRTGTVIVLFPN